MCLTKRTAIFADGYLGEGCKLKLSQTKQTAIFAGGCFWGVEESLRNVNGVISTEVGYIGGDKKNPAYDDVQTGNTGHAEAVRVTFDSRSISFEELTRLFFGIHDPTQVDRQGSDVGPQYRSEIFYLSPRQRETARQLIETLRKRGYRITTRLTPASRFHRAEECHQHYLEKSGRSLPCDMYTKRFGN